MSLVARAMLAVLCPCLCKAAAPSQQVYLKALNRSALDSLGSVVAISGDTAVIGAPAEDSGTRGVNGDASNDNALDSGAAYVFARQDGVWVQQAYLKASNSDARDGFGCAVAIAGDTIVVGAMQEDSSAAGVNGNQNANNATSSGAAYIFTRTAGTWSQQAYLKVAEPHAWDLFGMSVAISGGTVVVGANRESSAASGVNGNASDTSASHSGAAYVFVRNGSTWTQEAYLKASDTAANAEFGSAVGISGDVVVVGAPFAADGSGAVHVFQRSGGQWSHATRIIAPNAASGMRFGFAVSVSGESFVCGAPGEASDAPESGAVYVFTRSGNAWPLQAYLKASNSGAGDDFGDAVALDGDRLVAGAYGEDSNASGVDGNSANDSAEGAGAAYLFSRSAGQWQQDAYLKASNSEAGDWFGGAVAISATTVLVGAERESGSGAGVYAVQSGNGATWSGAAYGFVIPVSDPEIVVEVAGAPELQDGGALGFAMAVPGATTSRALTIRNTGSGPLAWSGCSFTGTDAARFSIDSSAMQGSIAPGGQGILVLRFSGPAVGSYSASLAIASDDADEASFDLNLSAGVDTAASLYAAWTNANGLTGPAADLSASPKGDGVANLLKYAFRLNGAAPDVRNLDAGGGSAGLPVAKLIVGSGGQDTFRLEYLRRKGSGLSYLPKVSSSPSAAGFGPMIGTVTVADLDAQWERVRIDQPRPPGEPVRFAKVEVVGP
ncbi:choice-of-anchor D domain-containing protein [Haloferula sp. BvORR071]|uniref:choice-of-anchor D domain-containing protein n=1 Tax=Haloferula sp. BvORR071 TaxID=1396141 RepID=UPI0006973531|nr:choice-of-anchor D domain-containing protein [Haloferula sp. BvORR071]